MRIEITSMEDLRREVRAQRRRRGYTQSEVARSLGHPQKYLSQLENSNIDPRISDVLKVIKVLGFSIYLEAADDGVGQDDEEVGL